MYDKETFLSYLRIGFDYGTGIEVPFKEDFVQRVSDLLDRYPLESSEYHELVLLVMGLQTAIAEKFAQKDRMLENYELDLSKACVFDFCYAYAYAARGVLENRLHLKPIPDEEANVINFEDDEGEIVFFINLPENFSSNPFYVATSVIYNMTDNDAMFYVFSFPNDDSEGESEVVYSANGMGNPTILPVQTNGFVHTLEAVSQMFEVERTKLINSINRTPRFKRAVNLMCDSVGVATVPLFNISGVFVNAMCDAMQAAIEDENARKSMYNAVQFPSGLWFAEQRASSCLFDFANRTACFRVPCDWGRYYPFMIKIANGVWSEVQDAIYAFDGSTLDRIY